MAIEIERKFTVTSDTWRSLVSKSYNIRQGYFACQGATLRLRVRDDEAFITIKGPTTGLSRSEYEYPIPAADATQMMDAYCVQPTIAKTRHLVTFDRLLFEIDEFHGDNQGLIVAEIELDHEDQRFELPPWVGEDVSDDRRYRNSALVLNPFTRW